MSTVPEYEQKPARRSRVEAGPEAGEPAPRSLRLLEATTLKAARRNAFSVLKRARQCDCCSSLLAHVFDRLGSTLFFDDDPEQLSLAFEPEERDRFSPLVLAACIVVSGRERLGPAGLH